MSGIQQPTDDDRPEFTGLKEAVDHYINRVGSRRLAIVVAVGTVIYVARPEETTQALRDVPKVVWVLLAAALLAYGVGLLVRDKIVDLLWSTNWTWLIDLDHNNDRRGLRIWKLSRGAVEELDVEGGKLREWPSLRVDVYECQGYDQGENVAQGWYSTDETDGVLSQEDRESLINHIKGQRRMHHFGAAIVNNITTIVRRIDQRRSFERNAVIDDHLAPGPDEQPGSLDVVREVVPDDVLPAYLEDGEPDVDPETKAREDVAQATGLDQDLVEDLDTDAIDNAVDGVAADGGKQP